MTFLKDAALAAAAELARIDDRGEDLIEETDPRTCAETIEDWERMVGLPDEFVTEIPATLAERRIAVTQKLVAQGGQSRAWFVALAAACGYTATFSNYNTLLPRVGRVRCGDRLYGTAYAYTMLVSVSAVAGTALSTADFERVIQHATHSHIQVVFEY